MKTNLFRLADSLLTTTLVVFVLSGLHYYCSPLDRILRDDDKMFLSTEARHKRYKDQCYLPSYALSTAVMRKKSQGPMNAQLESLFRGKVLVSWQKHLGTYCLCVE